MNETIKSIRQDALELCRQMEKCGASDEITNASVMALALHTRLVELAKDAEMLAAADRADEEARRRFYTEIHKDAPEPIVCRWCGESPAFQAIPGAYHIHCHNDRCGYGGVLANTPTEGILIWNETNDPALNVAAAEKGAQ